MKTSELTGVALDWAVAVCEGATQDTLESYADGLREADDGNYSTNWAEAGPIIEREDINVDRLTRSEVTESGSEIYRKDGWTAFTTVSAYWITPIRQYGPTPLIAAMRCYCCAILGDEIDIPKELQPCQHLSN